MLLLPGSGATTRLPSQSLLLWLLPLLPGQRGCCPAAGEPPSATMRTMTIWGAPSLWLQLLPPPWERGCILTREVRLTQQLQATRKK